MKTKKKDIQDRIHKPFIEYKNSKDPIERLVYFINNVSPHNYWKGYEAIEEFYSESYEKGYEDCRKFFELEKDILMKDKCWRKMVVNKSNKVVK